MKKSNFVALVLSVIATLLFGIGMCMCLLPQWDLFDQGILLGSIALFMMLLTVVVYRSMEHKAIIPITGKTILTIVIGIIGIFGLGGGMCLTMVYHQFSSGIVIGIAGICVLLCLIPRCKGLR